MSNKGIPQTAITKQKISLAQTKDRAELLLKIKNYILALSDKDIPSITRCAIYAGITEKALLSAELRSDENSELRILMDMIRDLSKVNLMEGGLRKNFDARMSAFLLEANHGMRKEAPSLTQNNFFQGLTPDLLAEAIDLTRQKNGNTKDIKSKK